MSDIVKEDIGYSFNNSIFNSNLDETKYELIKDSDSDVYEPFINMSNNLKDNNEELNEEHQIQIQSKPKSERVYWIDWLRVFSSMLVVYIHCSGISLKPRELFSYNWNALFFHNSIPRPCVPLFFMISGIFFLNPKKKLSYKKLYMKNVVRLLKCYVVWVIYYKTINAYVVNYNNYKFDYNMDLLKQILKNLINIYRHEHLWYIRSTIILYVFTPLFRIVTYDKKIARPVTIFLIIITQFLPTVFYYQLENKYHIIDITEKISNITYFFMGYLLYDHKFSKRIYVYSLELLGFCSIILTVYLRFMACHRKNKENNDFGSYDSFNVALSAYGIFTFFQYTLKKYIDPLMKKKKIKNFILKLSECSFGVYLVHMTVYHLLIHNGLHTQSFNPLWWVIVYSAIVYTISFIIIYFMRKIPFIKSIV